MTPDLAALHANRDQVQPLFAEPSAPWLDRNYAPGKWTARQLLFHIADTETVILDRIRRGIADAKPLLWAFDPDAWASHLASPQRSLTTALALFSAARASILDLATCVDPARFDRAVVHVERGKMTTGDWFGLAAWHAGHHAEQVAAIRDGKPWTAKA